MVEMIVSGALGYILGFLASLLGFPAGYFLAKIAEEELKAGRKYFVFLKYFFFAAIVAVLLCMIFAGFTSELFLILIALIFLCGLPAGTLFMQKKLIKIRKNKS